jgi:hypothetical protein
VVDDSQVGPEELFPTAHVIVNVCPAPTTSAPPDRVWRVLTAPEGFGEWLDAEFVSASSPGPIHAGQQIQLSAHGRELATGPEKSLRDLIRAAEAV